MFVTGPKVVEVGLSILSTHLYIYFTSIYLLLFFLKEVTKEKVTVLELGGAMVHTKKSGNYVTNSTQRLFHSPFPYECRSGAQSL